MPAAPQGTAGWRKGMGMMAQTASERQPFPQKAGDLRESDAVTITLL